MGSKAGRGGSLLRRLNKVVLVSVVFVGLLSGCGLLHQGPSAEEQNEIVRSALIATVPSAIDAFVDVYYQGPKQGYAVTVYVSEVADEDLAQIVDRSLEATWAAASFSPNEVGLVIVEGARQPELSPAATDGVDLGPVIDELNLVGVRDPFDVLFVQESLLESRYGEWTESTDD